MNARFKKIIYNKCKFMLNNFEIFVYFSSYLYLKSFFMEMRLSNIFKTTNVPKLTKAILESSYRVLQVTYKQKTLKKPVHFLRDVVFCPTSDIQIDINLAILLQNYTFYRVHRSLSKHANFHINGAIHYKMMIL